MDKVIESAHAFGETEHVPFVYSDATASNLQKLPKFFIFRTHFFLLYSISVSILPHHLLLYTYLQTLSLFN